MTARARLLSALAGLLASLLTFAFLIGPAQAVEPFNVVGEVTDQVGALGDRTGEVEAALERLSDDTPLQLFVVYVDSFEGLDGLTWANETAIASGLGDEDLLLAVAIGERRYGVSVAEATPLSEEWLSAVRTERIEPALSTEDWAGAGIAAAEGYREAFLAGDAAPGDGESGGSGSGLVTFLIIVGVIVGLVVLIVVIRRRVKGPQSRHGHAGVGPDGKPLAADDPRRLTTEELSRRAGSALVAIDDALRTSEQELGFAQAQFGLEATGAFSTALATAKQDVARAFMLQQQLDDATPETEPQARAMMVEIVETCERVSDDLDDHAEEFERLRDLQARAPQVLGEVEQRATEVARRLEPARSRLTQLGTTYPAPALASVAANPDQAETLLDAVHATVARGRAHLADDDRAGAVTQARLAEDAVAQAVLLLDAVDRADQDLAQAGQRLQASLASISADLADAQRLAPDDPAVTAAATLARQRVAEGQAAANGGDPLTALRNLTQAEAALDAALGPAREHDEQARRAAALLSETVGRVTSQVRSVNDFIETRRGAVGPEARTRLAEAIRFLGDATNLQATEPVTALQYAQHAEGLVGQAQSMAHQDVQSWERAQQRGGAGGFGAMGGLGRSTRGRGPNAGAMVLGGILLDRAVRGGGRRMGGFGAGGFGGGNVGVRRSGGSTGRASRRSSGSSGGRSRKGGGGRF